MKKILDIENCLKEAEDTFIKNIDSDDKIKIKHKKNDHILTEWILSKIEDTIDNDSKLKKVNLKTNKKLNKQEVHTLKKSALDNLSSKIFKKINKDYFSNHFIIKINESNKPEDFPINLDNKLVYVYFNTDPLALIKLSKNMVMLDPISGISYTIEEYYQNSIKSNFIAPMEKMNISMEFYMFFGYIVLNK